MNRQYVLAGLLGLIVAWFVGESLWNDMVHLPLVELQDQRAQAEEDISKRIKLMKQTKALPPKIKEWRKQALPANEETARSLYRGWLLEVIRDTRLRNARVDSGSPSSRKGGYKLMPFSVQCRGTLPEITDALFRFENAAVLHRINNIRLTPIGNSGQFDLAMGIEAVMIRGVKAPFRPGVKPRLVSKDRRAYDVIALDNMFGLDIDHRDPMKMTLLTAVIERNGVPQVWITEQIDDRVHKLAQGAEFETTALTGKVVQVQDDSVIIESGGQQLQMNVGQSFADAVVVSGS